jgi:hypothetical protein
MRAARVAVGCEPNVATETEPFADDSCGLATYAAFMPSSRPVIARVERALVLATACVASPSYAGFTNSSLGPDALAGLRADTPGMALSGRLAAATWSGQVGLRAPPVADGPAAAYVCVTARHDVGAGRSLQFTMEYAQALDGSGAARRAQASFVRRF